MNHMEYKDVFLLQDINIKIHKIMVLMCSATLNRLEINTQASTLTYFSTCPFGQLTKKSTCPTQSFSCPKNLIKITKTRE